MKKSMIVVGRYLFSCCCFILPALFITAQQVPEGYTDEPKFIDKVELGRNYLITYNMTPEYGTQGTPYLYEEFQEGELFFKNRKKMSDLRINYDCITRDLLFFADNKVYKVTREDVEYFAIYPVNADTAILFSRQFLPKEKQPEFLEVLYDVQSILYKRHLKTYKEAEVKTPYHPNRDYNQYIDQAEYFLRPGKDELIHLKPNKKALQQAYPDKAVQIKNFIKKEEINFKKESDLIRTIKFCDSI